MKNCSTEAKVAKKEVQRLKQRIQEMRAKQGITVDDHLSEDLSTILHKKTDEIRKTSPRHISTFVWEQQVEALSVPDRRQVRWHPMIIKWCLSMKLISSGSYALRSSKVVILPSDRTYAKGLHPFCESPSWI